MKKRMLNSLMCCVMMWLLLAGCAGQKRVVVVHDTVDNSVTHTVYRYQVDSVYVDRWHSVAERGDTVWMVDSVWMYHLVAVHDTVRDSVKNVSVVNVPYEVVVEKEVKVRGLFWWIGLVALIGVCAWVVVRWSGESGKLAEMIERVRRLIKKK